MKRTIALDKRGNLASSTKVLTAQEKAAKKKMTSPAANTGKHVSQLHPDKKETAPEAKANDKKG